MATLKPCPFCGRQAGFSRIPGQGFSVLCPACGALAVLVTSSLRDALGAAWNRRALRPNFSAQGKLEACPFCASRMDVGTADRRGSILRCGGCGMMVSFIDSDELADTVKRWNARVP